MRVHIAGLAPGTHFFTVKAKDVLGKTEFAHFVVDVAASAVTLGGAVRADLDSDRKSDSVWRNTTTEDTYCYLMNGMAITGEGHGRNVPTNWQVSQ